MHDDDAGCVKKGGKGHDHWERSGVIRAAQESEIIRLAHLEAGGFYG